MARLFTDGAEFADLLALHSSCVNVSASTTQKRSGNYSYKLLGAATSKLVYYFASAQSEVFLRFGIYTDSLGYVHKFPEFNAGATNLCSLRQNTGSFKLEAYVSGSLVATGLTALTINAWHLIEVHFKLNDTGDFEVKLDGVLDIDYAGDTKPDANTTFDNIVFSMPQTGVTVYYDDFAINDTSTVNDNSWCGDGYIVLLNPNGNGDVNQFINSDGNSINNYSYVDEIPPDGDTTYVKDSVIGQQDLYTLSDFAGTNRNISRVWVEARAKSTSSGGETTKLIVKTGGTIYASSALPLTTDYTRILGEEYIVNPNTGLAWTDANLDGLQAGAEIS